jgi:hypothetical protein
MAEKPGRRPTADLLTATAVLLAMAQFLAEDLSVLAAWPYPWRLALHLAGFGFDLLFTVEFLVRLVLALAAGRAGRYLGPKWGWLDFLASVPPLALASAPLTAQLLLGPLSPPLLQTAGVLAAGQAARLLRLLRPARLPGRLLGPASATARRHASLLTLLATAALTLGLMAFTLAAPRLRGPEAQLAGEQQRTAERLLQASRRPGGLRHALAGPTSTDLLVLRQAGLTRYSRLPDEAYAREFAPGDYRYLRLGDLELFFDERAQARQAAAGSLLFQILALLLFLAHLLFYAGNFARTLADPLRVMRRGLAEPGFNLQVRLPARYRGEEVFQLAAEYNERFLPLKERDRRGAPPALLSPGDALPPQPGAEAGAPPSEV